MMVGVYCCIFSSWCCFIFKKKNSDLRAINRPISEGWLLLDHTNCSTSPFITALACSYGWSIAIAGKFWQDLCTKLATSRWYSSRNSVFLRWMESQQHAQLKSLLAKKYGISLGKASQHHRVKLASLNDRINASIFPWQEWDTVGLQVVIIWKMVAILMIWVI